MKNQVRPVCSPKDKIWSRTDKLQRCRPLPLEESIFLSRVEGAMSRARVACRGSRVTFLFFQFFFLEKVIIDAINVIKRFCLRDRGRLGNRGRSIWFKFGTLSYYGFLCNMPKFQLHCSHLG